LGGRQESPSEAILNMRLPPAEAMMLGALLSGIACELDEGEIDYRLTYRYTIIRGQDEQRVLLHIPGSILDSPNPQKDAALTSLPFVFKGFSRLFVLSEGLDAIPTFEYSEMLLRDWPEYAGIAVDWVPWSHLKGLQRKDLSADQLHRNVRRLLNLSDPNRASQKQPETRDLYGKEFRKALRGVLVDRLREVELRALVEDVGGDYENLEGDNKMGKVLSLLEYARSHGLIEELLLAGQELRSDISWEDVGA
jgi:hypothetical protein